MKITPSEHDIQTAILNMLPYYNVYAWRNNSGMIAVGEGKYRRMIRLGTAGLPDIIGVHKDTGRLVACEVKKPGKKPTVLQQQMMDKLEEYGAIVFVASSINDVTKVFGKRNYEVKK
jgi:hypothetical protein